MKKVTIEFVSLFQILLARIAYLPIFLIYQQKMWVMVSRIGESEREVCDRAFHPFIAPARGVADYLEKKPSESRALNLRNKTLKYLTRMDISESNPIYPQKLMINPQNHVSYPQNHLINPQNQQIDHVNEMIPSANLMIFTGNQLIKGQKHSIQPFHDLFYPQILIIDLLNRMVVPGIRMFKGQSMAGKA